MTKTQNIAIIAVAIATIVISTIVIVLSIRTRMKNLESIKDMDFNFIKEFETGSTTPKLTVFKNAIDGNLEVGYGHVLNKAIWEVGDTITKEQAEEFFMEDIEKAYDVYGSRLNWDKFTANQKRAIISHAYNTGARSETIILKANTGKWEELASWWREHYVTSGGKKLNGLVKRRAYEANLLTK